MKRIRKTLPILVTVLLVVLLLGGYQIYRYPAMFRNLTDKTLSEEETEALRDEILSEEDPNPDKPEKFCISSTF